MAARTRYRIVTGREIRETSDTYVAEQASRQGALVTAVTEADA